MNSNKTRTFISIEFPDEIIKEVARIQSILQNKKFIGRLTELENLHLTLKFLGEINNTMLTKVKHCLSNISFPEIKSTLSHAGTFSYKKAPKIVWIKISGKSLINLQKEIDSSLKQLFPPEKRFMSHLTIARIKYVKDSEEFIKYTKNISIKPISFQIKNFKLMSSELKPMGPIYTTLQIYNFTTSDNNNPETHSQL